MINLYFFSLNYLQVLITKTYYYYCYHNDYDTAKNKNMMRIVTQTCATASTTIGSNAAIETTL